ncbi:hypothetical protein L3X38_015292 [Prunus dulcis]|uniref:Uncharacterized protein n=1 Tax=Prunus dulcis TaxID=3755 RepID=A0AAD4WQD5_PRUDU|nr:hypothetical protein L3X38_015292 [Prunus dulcis]
MWLEKCLGRIWLRTPGILFGLAVVSGLNFQIAYLPTSHNHFSALSLKRQNQSDIKTRKAFFVLGLCCFWVLQQPQHRRLLDSHHLRGPSYCPLRCWFCFVLVASCFASNKNTRKVFSEYHNVPMDTHKVFTALVQWGSCRSPSVIHNREVLVRALFVIFNPTSIRVIRTVGARIADQVDQMSPESSEDYRSGRVTIGVTRN